MSAVEVKFRIFFWYVCVASVWMFYLINIMCSKKILTFVKKISLVVRVLKKYEKYSKPPLTTKLLWIIYFFQNKNHQHLKYLRFAVTGRKSCIPYLTAVQLSEQNFVSMKVGGETTFIHRNELSTASNREVSHFAIEFGETEGCGVRYWYVITFT